MVLAPGLPQTEKIAYVTDDSIDDQGLSDLTT